jgi:TonB family protein
MKELFARGKMVAVSENHAKINELPFVGLVTLLFIFCMVSISWAAPEYRASEVDSPPKIVRQTPVKYPSQAKKNGVTGKVIVRCLIGVDGKAEKLEIVKSEPLGVFDDSALSTLKYWQFRPGIKSGQLVSTWVTLPIKFE